MGNKVTKETLKMLIEGVLNEKATSFGTPPIVPNLKDASGKLTTDGEAVLNKVKSALGDSKTKAKNSIDSIAKSDGDVNDISNNDLVNAYKSLNKASVSDATKMAKTLKSLSDLGNAEEKKKHDVNAWAALSTRSSKSEMLDPKNPDLYHEDPSKITEEDIRNYLFVYQKLPSSYKPSELSLDVDKAEKEDVFDFDLRNYNAAEGKYPDQIASVFQVLFGGETSFLKRMKMVIDFSNAALQTSADDEEAKNKIKALGLQKFMQNIMALDYISSIVKNLESGSGAYQFETFLALLAGGKVTGKAPDSDSQDTSLMGATDFEATDMNGQIFKGSSKYYSKFAGLKQSAKGFEQGQYVHYIIAIKKGETGEGTSEAGSITSLSIHWLIIHCFEKQGGKAKFKYYSPLGNTISIDTVSQEFAKFDSSMFQRATYIGDLQLVSKDTTKFKDQAGELAGKLEGNFKQVFELTSSSVKNTTQIKDGVTKYSASGKINDGQSVVNGITELKNNVKVLLDLLGSLGPDEEYEKIDTSSLQERKVSGKMLKKIIEESFKKNK